MNATGPKEAAAARPQIICNATATHLLRVPANRINIYKQLELWKKYRPHIGGKTMNDDLYQELSKELIKAVLTKRGQQKNFLEKLAALKKEFKSGQRSTKEN